jgi:hypothetical protein
MTGWPFWAKTLTQRSIQAMDPFIAFLRARFRGM